MLPVRSVLLDCVFELEEAAVLATFQQLGLAGSYTTHASTHIVADLTV